LRKVFAPKPGNCSILGLDFCGKRWSCLDIGIKQQLPGKSAIHKRLSFDKFEVNFERNSKN